MTNYREKLKDPRWQKRRLQALESAKWRCQICEDGTNPLNVHHLYYQDGLDPWEYPAIALICLCETCHDQIHAATKGCEECHKLSKALADTERMWREERDARRAAEAKLDRCPDAGGLL